ncbi:MAG: glycosyltransferase [Bryobacterales bacterium]|nr:glycosyltransferase [Bryobacterales bacterium]
MRVLQLGPYPPPYGGVETNLVAIRKYLLDRGIPCAVVNLTRFRKAEADEVYYPRSAVELFGLLLRLRYDVVHLHVGGNFAPRLLGLSLLCSLIPGAKTVLSFHSGGYPGSPEGRTARPFTLRGFVFRRFDRLIAVNSEIARMFRKFGVEPNRIRQICPHTFSQPADAPLPEPMRAFFASHEHVLLTVGGLKPEYDLPLQISTLGKVRERFPGAGLVILGEGSLKRQLQELIARQPWAEHILLFGDSPHQTTLRAMADCTILLRTTLYDGDSIAVREALSLGTPVIASDNGMRPEGVTLIPVSDPVALEDAIARLLTDTPTRTAALEEGERNIAEVFELYREIASG